MQLFSSPNVSKSARTPFLMTEELENSVGVLAVPVPVTVPLPDGVVQEGAPADVSCRNCVPLVFPGSNAHDVHPDENVAQYTKSPTSEAVGNILMRAAAALVALVPPEAMTRVADSPAAVPLVFWLNVGKLVRFAALNVGAV